MDNFIVSARKYRPATFESVIGQKHITSTLRNAISRNQLAHAYLFCGPRGVGKTTCARIFAKAINCQNPGAEGVCGECESCRSFTEGRSFNIHELDAASNNSVDDIRSLTEQVRIPPQIGRYSVYIIDEVHMLSAQAFNAFLKTLEEPPAHAVFILATTEKHKIIPTILSRCQIFDFNRIRVEDGVEYLKYIASQENVAFDDESLHLIAQKADGGMRDALSMFDKAVSFCGSDLNFKQVAQTLNVLDYDTYFKLTSLILEGNYPEVLTLFDEVLRKGFSGQIFISGLNTHFRDLLMCKNPQTLSLLELSGTLLEKYKQQAASCDTNLLFDSIALLTALDGTLRTASNQRLNVELALMKLCGLGQKKNSEPVVSTSEPAVSTPVTPKSPVNGLPELGKMPVKQPAKEEPRPAVEPEPKQASQNIPQEVDTKTDPIPAGMVASQPLPEEAADIQAVPVDNDGGAVGTGPIPVPAPVEVASSRTTDDTGNASEESSSPKTEQQPTDIQAPASKQTTGPAATTTPVTSIRNGNGRPTISGPSISDLLVKPKGLYESEGAETDKQEDTSQQAVDPRTEDKINSGKEVFIEKLNSERPRIAVAFRDMKVKGNIVTLTVPTETFREEILRNRTELLTMLADSTRVEGFIELNVDVKEDTAARKPIKVEDKLRHLTELNPTLTLLRQKLDMDVE